MGWGWRSGPLSEDPFFWHLFPFPSLALILCRAVCRGEIHKVLQNLPQAPFFLSTPSPYGLLPPICPSPILVLLGALLSQASSSALPQGTHQSLKGNAKALSTVSAIIDGTGSIGL